MQALRNPRVLWLLAVGAVGFGGFFAVYAFLTAAMIATTDAPAYAIPLALGVFGVGGTLGTWFAGRLTERVGQIRAAYISLAAMAATQGFASLAVGSWPMMVLSSFLLAAGWGWASSGYVGIALTAAGAVVLTMAVWHDRASGAVAHCA